MDKEINSVPYVVHEGILSRMERSNKRIVFNGNVAIPATGTVSPIGVAITLNGEPRLTSRAIYTPAAVETYGNVTSTAIIKVPKGCCFSMAVEYVAASTDPVPTAEITVQNANMRISRIA